MSPLEKEINELLDNSFEKNEKGFQSRLIFDTHFIGFKGHFPDTPVLPGIVMIQLMILMCERAAGTGYRLACIKDARFTEPVLPGEKITASLPHFGETKEGVKVKGIFYKGEKTAAGITLLLEPEQRRE
ncbi:MAG: hypothetical protein ACQETC_10405 [Thermodesulfobacteriota bacterium]